MKYLNRLALLVLLCLSPMVAEAQLTSPVPTAPSLSTSAATVDKSLSPPTTEMPAGGSVDPNEYHLGPGDVLQLRFWTSDQSMYPIVTGDQLLVLPRIGEFSVRGKTLAQVRDEVYKQASEIFADAKLRTSRNPVTLSLYQARKILVKVKGDVLAQGVFTLSAATRADVALELANKPPVETQTPDHAAQLATRNTVQRERQIESLLGDRSAITASRRYISISHPDGSLGRLDLVRWEGTHDPAAAPLLRENDVLVVPVRDASLGTIGVYGAVQSPGAFEYVKGDSLSGAIRYAFGPSAGADIHHIELVRLSITGELEAPQIVDLAAIEAHKAPDIALEKFDRILVHGAAADPRRPGVAIVRGEVMQPGAIAIKDEQTTLSEVIRAAGGLTPLAYPAGSVVLRHGREDVTISGDAQSAERTALMENLGTADTGSLHKQIKMRQPLVVVDMERLLTAGDKSADIALRDGDEVVIVPRPTTVYVYGFVNSPGFVTVQPGAALAHYITSAGGYAIGGTPGRTVVIKAKNKAWMSPSDTRIEAGDEIFVPKEPDEPPGLAAQNLATAVSAAASLLTSLLFIYQAFIKK